MGAASHHLVGAMTSPSGAVSRSAPLGGRPTRHRTRGVGLQRRGLPSASFQLHRELQPALEEPRIPLRYGSDLAAAERIVVDAARANTVDEVAMGREQLDKMRKLYLVEPTDLEPQVFLQLTDNGIELSVRSLGSTHGVRAVKDRIARKVLADLGTAGIDVASQTFEIVRAPAVTVTEKAK